MIEHEWFTVADPLPAESLPQRSDQADSFRAARAVAPARCLYDEGSVDQPIEDLACRPVLGQHSQELLAVPFGPDGPPGKQPRLVKLGGCERFEEVLIHERTRPASRRQP